MEAWQLRQRAVSVVYLRPVVSRPGRGRGQAGDGDGRTLAVAHMGRRKAMPRPMCDWVGATLAVALVVGADTSRRKAVARRGRRKACPYVIENKRRWQIAPSPLSESTVDYRPLTRLSTATMF